MPRTILPQAAVELALEGRPDQPRGAGSRTRAGGASVAICYFRYVGKKRSARPVSNFTRRVKANFAGRREWSGYGCAAAVTPKSTRAFGELAMTLQVAGARSIFFASTDLERPALRRNPLR